jgi:hypothetical protein
MVKQAPERPEAALDVSDRVSGHEGGHWTSNLLPMTDDYLTGVF